MTTQLATLSTALSDSAIGPVIKRARESKGLSGRQLAEATGISLRTLIKIEQDDDSVALKFYRLVARHLNIEWVFCVFNQAGETKTNTPLFYLSGATALALPGPDGQPPALWYTSALTNPHSWRISGRDLESTTKLLGVTGLWDATKQIEQYGVFLPRIWAASPERAVFDLLIHYCESKRKTVPNIQASDIDDVVDLRHVEAWIKQCEPFLSVEGVQGMRSWLTEGF